MRFVVGDLARVARIVRLREGLSVNYAAVGLVLLSTSSSYDLWQVAGPVGRVRVVAPDGTVTVLASGPLDTSGVSVPAAGAVPP